MPSFKHAIESLISPKEVESLTQHYDIDLLARNLAHVAVAMEHEAQARHVELMEQATVRYNALVSLMDLNQTTDTQYYEALLEYMTTLH